jgi:hypothetical protein
LQFGEAGGVRTTRTPTVLRTVSIADVQFGSRSHSRIRPSRRIASVSPRRPRSEALKKRADQEKEGGAKPKEPVTISRAAAGANTR